MRGKNKCITSIKIISLIVLLCICHHYDDDGIFSKYFSNAFYTYNTYITRTERTLAIKIFQSKYKQEPLKVNLKLFNPKYTINNGSHKISSIYKDMKLLDECVQELLLDLPEKLDKHVVKDEITNKTLERALFKDYPIIHVIPLSRRIATILYDFTRKKIHEIAVHSIYNSLVIILTYKCNSNLYGKYTELNNIAFLTIVVICLSQILYNIGKFDFLKKYETPEMREKELAKEKKWEIKKKREQDVLKYKEIKKHGINDLDTYMQYYKQRYYSRKGLGKFDSYCEKYVFDKIHKIDRIAECSKSYNKKLKNNLCIKYLFYTISPCLFQFFVIIAPVLDRIEGLQFEEYKRSSILGTYVPTSVSYIYIALFVLLSYFILASIAYIMIKVVKYERLKSRKCKMNFKEYCAFCKEVLIK